ncbi:uncharacterized protein METZ01_LOCUS272249 [marine metagenome]|uniref:Uncharacterized protein n=1 Tax=marine metagenome TaxID=408172 RepID=A0A382K6S3_9ZZZZ
MTNIYSEDDDLAVLRLLKESRWIEFKTPTESLVDYRLD